MRSEILLMTGTISPGHNLDYQSTSISAENRKKQYLKSLIYYITQSDFNSVVFCENSDYKFTNSEMNNLLYLKNIYNKDIEFLHFKGNSKKTSTLGYGYGEGECLDYAFDNSRILKNAQTFYKITGRYIIGNINRIIDIHKNKKNLFIRNNIFNFFSMSTAFFKMEKDIYIKFFYNAKRLVNHQKNINAEAAFYEILYKNNLLKINESLEILPLRTNYNNDLFPGTIYKFNIIRRPKMRYDFLLFNTGFYRISIIDKPLFKLIAPLTRRE